MDRFFVAPDDIKDGMVRITGEDMRHIARVLRLRAGDAIMLVDGVGMEHIARIDGVYKEEVCAKIETSRPCVTEPRHRVTLYQALPKADKMEWIIQKCVEIGVHAIVPVLTERCVKRPDEGKLMRYNRVAYEAAKQAQRGMVPEVMPLVMLEDCALKGYDRVLCAYEQEKERSLKQALRAGAGERIAIFIGPEGGFAQTEVDLLEERGAWTVSLGARILRTETAGMAMLGMILYELEN